ncbi:MAG: hypothetical protein PVF13_01485, partial [Chromatiales bacterium]
LAVIGGLWTALNYPLAFLLLLLLFMAAVVWLLPKLWRALKRLFHRIGRFFGGKGETEADLYTAEERHEAMKKLFPSRDESAEGQKK